MFIYKITNKINNKVYIGKTCRNILVRFKEHIRDSKSSDRPLHRAIRKYGIENFTIEILYTAQNEDELNLKEIEFISTLVGDNYNISAGGEGKLLYSREQIEKVFCETRSFTKTAKQIGCCYDVVAKYLTDIGYKADGLGNSIKRTSRNIESDLGVFNSIGEAAEFCVSLGLAKSRKACARSIQDSCANRRNKVCGVKWKYKN